MATSNARQSINEADPDRQPHQVELPTGPTHIAARSNRTPQQVESNRVFMAAAGRVKFGRHEATLHAVWIAFALFASLGPERICYAAVERKREDEDEDKPGIAERARVSGRTVRRHIPALIDRGLIKAENRVGGRTPTVWKVILPDELIGPELTACPPRPDTVSDDIKDRTYVQGRAPFRGQARPCEKGLKVGSRPPKSPPGRSVLQEHGSIPNTTAAPPEGLACSLAQPTHRGCHTKDSTTTHRGHAGDRPENDRHHHHHHGRRPAQPLRHQPRD